MNKKSLSLFVIIILFLISFSSFVFATDPDGDGIPTEGRACATGGGDGGGACVPLAPDNCPSIANANQLDSDFSQDWASASLGANLIQGLRGNALIDNSHSVSGWSNCNAGSSTCNLTIDLGQIRNINLIKTHLYDGDSRTYSGYSIYISVDNSNWVLFVNKLSSVVRSNQTDTSSNLQSARYLRYQGKRNTVSAYFDIIEVDAYAFDGFGDVCDNCPNFVSSNQADYDADGFGDVCDIPTNYVNATPLSGIPSNYVNISGTSFMWDKSQCSTPKGFWWNLSTNPMVITGGNIQVYSIINGDYNAKGIGYCIKDSNGNPLNAWAYVNISEVDTGANLHRLYTDNYFDVVSGSFLFDFSADSTHDNYTEGYSEGEFYFNFIAWSTLLGNSGLSEKERLYIKHLGGECSPEGVYPSGDCPPEKPVCVEAHDSCFNDPNYQWDPAICGRCLLDRDQDRAGDPLDSCPTCPYDNCPNAKNSDQGNVDGDGFGDACDWDIDGDGISNDLDNCPGIPNLNQSDNDNDKIGDVCDYGRYSVVCYDGDRLDLGWSLYVNSSTYVRYDWSNSSGSGFRVVQENESCFSPTKVTEISCVERNGAGIGGNSYTCSNNCTNGACDTDYDGDKIPSKIDNDDDGDGINDVSDNCPIVSNNGQVDSDHDEIGDVCDPYDGLGLVRPIDLVSCTVDEDCDEGEACSHGNCILSAGGEGASCSDPEVKGDLCGGDTPICIDAIANAEINCCKECKGEARLGLLTGTISYVTMKACRDSDGDGAANFVEVTCLASNAGGFDSCYSNPISEADLLDAGVESAIVHKGICVVDTSVPASWFGVSALIVVFVILIIYYIFRSKKNNRKVLKKKKH